MMNKQQVLQLLKDRVYTNATFTLLRHDFIRKSDGSWWFTYSVFLDGENISHIVAQVCSGIEINPGWGTFSVLKPVIWNGEEAIHTSSDARTIVELIGMALGVHACEQFNFTEKVL
jgi:hypothetical protein